MCCNPSSQKSVYECSPAIISLTLHRGHAGKQVKIGYWYLSLFYFAYFPCRFIADYRGFCYAYHTNTFLDVLGKQFDQDLHCYANDYVSFHNLPLTFKGSQEDNYNIVKDAEVDATEEEHNIVLMGTLTTVGIENLGLNAVGKMQV